MERGKRVDERKFEKEATGMENNRQRPSFLVNPDHFCFIEKPREGAKETVLTGIQEKERKKLYYDEQILKQWRPRRYVV